MAVKNSDGASGQDGYDTARVMATRALRSTRNTMREGAPPAKHVSWLDDEDWQDMVATVRPQLGLR